ncbi:MAG: hypothetical protein K0U98_12785 [Deltaproteobacteria bacterium]|nr:hypothetical protein [Deltaproteobacteria bacterium]
MSYLGEAVSPIPPPEYLEERDESTRLIRSGQFQQALIHLERCEGIALAKDLPALLEMAIVNRCRVHAEVDPKVEGIAELRRLITNGVTQETRFRACVALASIYRGREEWAKVEFYANCALVPAGKNRHFQADVHSCLGVRYLASNDFSKALRAFELGLELLGPAGQGDRRSLLLEGVGVSLVLLGRLGEALRALSESLTTAKAAATPWIELETQLSLSFAYLEQSNAIGALAHGNVARGLADRQSRQGAQKKALYLLGEAHKLAGEETAAYGYYRELHHRFLPEFESLPDLLLRTDTRGLVNIL